MRSLFLIVCFSLLLQTVVRAGQTRDAKTIRGLVEKLGDTTPQVRGDAAEELRRFGPEAKSAIPALISLLGDDSSIQSRGGAARQFQVKDYAIGTLVSTGPEAVADLTAALANPSPQVRAHAAFTLGRIGPKARTALPAMLRAAADADRNFRLNAANALPALDDSGDKSVPLLLEWLNDDVQYVRQSAVSAVGKFGNRASQAVPALLRSLRDKEPAVRGCAAKALGEIAKAPEDVIPALITAMNDDDEYPIDHGTAQVAHDAAWAIARFSDQDRELAGFDHRARAELTILIERISSEPTSQLNWFRIDVLLANPGPGAKSFIPTLTKILKRSDETRVRTEILTLFRNLGHDATSAAPAIRLLFDDEDTWLQVPAACALVAIDLQENEDAWQRLLAEMDRFLVYRGVDGIERSRDAEMIFSTLERLGAAAKPAAARLTEILKRIVETGSENNQIVGTLGQIGPAAKLASGVLIERLYPSYFVTDKKTQAALLAIGPDAIPELVAGLEKFASKELRCIAILEALGEFGEDAATAVPAIVRVSRDERRDVRAAATQALGQIGTPPEIVVPELIRLLKDERPLVREQAARSMARLKAAASLAVPGLTTALEDEYIDVRAAAAQALGEIGPSARTAIPVLKATLADSIELVRDAAATALESLK